MGFRHYEGTVKKFTTAWVCPTCKSENLGPLEAGCVSCKAGADAKAARETVLLGGPTEAIERQIAAFVTVTYPLGLDSDGWAVAREAFRAGALWAQAQQPISAAEVYAAVNPPEAEGGWIVELVNPLGVSVALNEPSQQTILAALAFYRDNQLAYGDAPGQLTAAEVSQLITKLTPKEGA